MNKITEFFKKVFSNRWVQLVLVAIFLFAAGYGTGRFAQPAKVVEKEKIVEKVVDKIVYQDRVVEKIVYVQVKQVDRKTKTVVEKRPDGSSTTTTETDTKSKTDTEASAEKVKEVIVYRDRVETKVVEKEKLVEAKKIDWLVHAGVGLSVPTFLGKQQYGIPGLRGAVIEAGIDRRVVGPFYLGVFGDSQGTVGLKLTGAF